MEMRPRRWCGLALAAVAVSGAERLSLAQSGPVVIAILPFEDRGSYGQDKEVFRALQLGIPATIAGELSGHSELRLADPSRVTRALSSQKLEPDARLDAATSARIAKEAGARYAITGSFADFYGKFRLDARIVDAESGQIVKVVTNNDPKLQDRAELYRIVQAVGHKVLAEASPSPGPGEVSDADARVVPTGALTRFSLGLLAESRGDNAEAARHFTEALSEFPNYPEAREGLHRVRRS
jgi:TolB-like protein